PNGWVRLVVVAAVAGFPFALALAWFFELTPEGLKLESEVDRSQPPARGAGRGFDRLIIAVLALALCLALADIFVLRKPAASTAGADRSIAVLPFESLSDDKANAYFADGIQDEILTRLAKIGALRVISRTSTQQYGARPANLADIARQLGVANILEGSVQKAGDAVHVNVQLIHAATDDHLWAESYDRKLDNVFGVESEVAQTVAEALQARLTGGERQALAVTPTANAQAYEAYLRGLGLEARAESTTVALIKQAEDSFAAAVRLDPSFALAWAHLSMAHSFRYFNLLDIGPELAGQAREAAQTAVRLQPELGEAHLALGFYHYRVERDFDGGLREFDAALQRLPNNAGVLAAISYIQRRQGRWEEAAARLEQASLLDPRNTALLTQLGGYYLALRRFAQAEGAYDRALAVAPGDAEVIAGKAGVLQSAGDLDGADLLLEPLPFDPAEPLAFLTKVQQAMMRGRYDQAIGPLQAALARPAPELDHFLALYNGNLGFALHLAGREDAARAACAESLKNLQRMRVSDDQDRELAAPLALANACLGRRDEALRFAQRAVDINAADAFSRPLAQTTRAQVQAWLGDTDEAIAALPQLLQVPNGTTVGDLRFNPLWNPLRADPRFRKLIEPASAGA
ncbi:MAG: tetratricopeptide repeat protein, partial [Nevskia sp.]|nr:tetratricopeptide repeat protein [Nevskia sp.]